MCHLYVRMIGKSLVFTMSVKKLNTLILQSKINLIKCREEQQASVKFLVEKFKCSKTQVYEILKHKQQIKGIWQHGLFSGKSKRKPRKTGNEEINKILHQWFLDARTRNLPISGLILEEQAKLIAERLGNADFKASNEWLSNFKSRYEITLKQICGESKDVNLDTVNDWQLQLKELIQNYSPENIRNCDETGLFFKALQSKTLTLKNPCIKLSNIELAFFPPNTTSLTQPIDQGVIQNMKLHYRKLVLQSLCVNISTCTSVTELSKKISVLNAIRWISSATKKIKKDCVKKCFRHAGFRFGEETEVENERNEALNKIEELIEELGSEDSITAESYIKIDKEVVTEGGYQTLDDLIEASHRQNEENNDEEEGQGLVMVVEKNEKIHTFRKALQKLTALEEFAENVNCPEMSVKLLPLRTLMKQNASRQCKKQSTLTEFWS